jgi:hypothetical protein
MLTVTYCSQLQWATSANSFGHSFGYVAGPTLTATSYNSKLATFTEKRELSCSCYGLQVCMICRIRLPQQILLICPATCPPLWMGQ